MKRLIFLTLTLFLLTMALTGGMVAYARTQSGENPLKTYGFDLCNGKPCFVGVTVGMSWDKAHTILSNRKEKDFEGEGFIQLTVGGISFGVFPDYDLRKVGSIRIIPSSPSLSVLPILYNFILQYGPPCFVSGGGSFILYEGFSFSVTPIESRISEFSDVSDIEVDSRPFCTDPYTDTIPWHGFAALARYQ